MGTERIYRCCIQPWTRGLVSTTWIGGSKPRSYLCPSSDTNYHRAMFGYPYWHFSDRDNLGFQKKTVATARGSQADRARPGGEDQPLLCGLQSVGGAQVHFQRFWLIPQESWHHVSRLHRREGRSNASTALMDPAVSVEEPGPARGACRDAGRAVPAGMLGAQRLSGCWARRACRDVEVGLRGRSLEWPGQGRIPGSHLSRWRGIRWRHIYATSPGPAVLSPGLWAEDLCSGCRARPATLALWASFCHLGTEAEAMPWLTATGWSLEVLGCVGSESRVMKTEIHATDLTEASVEIFFFFFFFWWNPRSPAPHHSSESLAKVTVRVSWSCHQWCWSKLFGAPEQLVIHILLWTMGCGRAIFYSSGFFSKLLDNTRFTSWNRNIQDGCRVV